MMGSIGFSILADAHRRSRRSLRGNWGRYLLLVELVPKWQCAYHFASQAEGTQ